MCTRINYKIVPLNNLTNNDTMVQVELRNMYINIGVNNGSEKLRKKKKHCGFRSTNYSSIFFVCLCLYLLYKLVRLAIV